MLKSSHTLFGALRRALYPTAKASGFYGDFYKQMHLIIQQKHGKPISAVGYSHLNFIPLGRVRLFFYGKTA